jgi:hypothetical protein
VGIPILIDVKDAKGTSSTRTTSTGCSHRCSSSRCCAAAGAFWVNDQVTAATPARRVDVDVGKPTASAPRVAP